MRAREPDIEGLIDRDGVRVGYQVWGSGPTTIICAPAWMISHSRLWRMQVPYLARYFRVITVDPRGNGASDRPSDPAAYTDVAHADDLVAVMDLLGVERAVGLGLSMGSWRVILAAYRHPARFSGLVTIASAVPELAAGLAERDGFDFEERLEAPKGWAKYNRHHWRTNYEDFARFFFHVLTSEPHSTRAFEDGVSWALDTDGETLITAEDAPPDVKDREEVEQIVAGVTCPILVIHGDDDRCRPLETGERIAELSGSPLIVVEGGGHLLGGRHPVAVNRWIRDFATRVEPQESKVDQTATRRWARALHRPKRVLYLSSPIGLGHARRDLAIVEQLRRQRPGVEVDWLAQHPVTALLEARGERVHPASALLASESAHWEEEADEHHLHAFQAFRRMDEILLTNFMVFADLVEEETYDLWTGDEAWDVDYFLHENPELKRTAYAWLTDFVGWLPIPDEGPPEAALTTDYNAEMIEQIARFPRVRDRALFVGDDADVVPDSFGRNLPAIRDWTTDHFDFTGYITGFDPSEIADVPALRAQFGWRPDEKICVVTVGGTRVGEPLLRRVIAAYPAAARLVPGLRMVVVAGPRIDPASLPTSPGLEVHAYLPDLHRRLAACDVAVVQGGLTTTMELTAAGRPFVYVPLRNHFEQLFHVPHRLARYGAGRRIDFVDTSPDVLAAAIAEEIGRTPSYRPVASDGAERAARYLAELI